MSIPEIEQDMYYPLLYIVEGAEKGKEYSFVDFITIGRGAGSDIRLKEAKVSRQHSQISLEEGSYWVEDLSCVGKNGNGTFINDEQVTKGELKDQDLLKVGDTVMLFRTPANHVSVTRQRDTVCMTEEVEEEANVDAVVSEDESKFEKTRAELKFDAQRSFLMNVEELKNIAAVERANDKLRILYEVNNTINTILDLQELLEKILDVVFQHIPAERGAILLYDPEKDELKSTITKLRDQQKQEGSIKLSKTLLSKVLEERVSLLTTDTMLDDDLAAAQSIITQGIRSAMSVPLISKDNLLGVLHIDTTQKSSQFNADSLELLTGIAGQSAMAIDNARLLSKIEKEIQTRGNLQRYLSPELVDQIINNQLDLNIGGQLKKGTVLFTDLRGFTKLTETIGAEAVVAILNNYFTRMVDIVFANGGTLDKFIGDAIMATWGIPIAKDIDSLMASKSAILMQRELFYFNLSQRKRGLTMLKMGAGINTGDIVVGNMGSPKRMEYTVIGPPVNLSSRVESKTKHNHVFISEYTYEEVKDRVAAAEMPHIPLKGIARPVGIFGIYFLQDLEGVKSYFLPVLARFDESMDSDSLEGLIQTFDGKNLTLHLEPDSNIQPGKDMFMTIDLPAIAPNGIIAVSCVQQTAKKRPTWDDEYLEVVAQIKNIPEELVQFLSPILA